MTDAYSQPSREWWAQRWIDVLESFGWTRRLARARTYAREGNVLGIDFQGAKVSANVQGTAPEPYKVSLSLDPFSDEQWSYVVESMAERAIFSAKLLAGEMPQNIEEVFTANGLSLFPFNKFDIHSRCSCPDPANPCKHIGAVYYLLGDRFSEDPFVLFQLRGRTKEQIIEALRQIRGMGSDPIAIEPSDTPTLRAATPLNLDRFWQYHEQLEPSLIVITPPPTSETVLTVLGTIPLKSDPPNQASTKTAMEYLTTVYETVSQKAVQIAMTTDDEE
ncbi:SWIM zinc finger family protein [Phormidesmis sp. 146-20]